MKISQKKTTELYGAIHEEISDVRIQLKDQLTAYADYVLAQVETRIWKNVKRVLNIPPEK